MPDSELPDEVVRLLNGGTVGGGQPVHQLFTVDDQGRPHATLSSARQWWIGDARLVCVLVAGRTSRYLSERPRALLVVVGARHAYSIHLTSNGIQDVEDRRVAVVLDIEDVASDSRGVALTPMLFHATDELARRESIGEHAAATAAQLAQQR